MAPDATRATPVAYTHLDVYKRQKYCSVFAAAGRDMPVTEEYRHVFGDVIKLASYALPGTKALMKHTASAVGDRYGAIMSNHGMITCGKDLDCLLYTSRCV